MNLTAPCPRASRPPWTAATLKVTADSAKAAGWKGSIPLKVTDGRSEPVKATRHGHGCGLQPARCPSRTRT